MDSNDILPTFQATYVPEFYRALHALAHAEFRSRKPGIRGAAALLKRPLLKWRVTRLARMTPARAPVLTRPVLTPQAAAVPSEQPH